MMKTFTIDNKYVIAFGSQDAALKFQLPLSHLIKEKYGDGPYSKIIVTQIISFCLDYYADRFEKICQTETSYTFYKMVFWFNEQVTEMRRDKDALTNLPVEIGFSYFAVYRRVLKMILEQGCSVKMVTGEKIDEKFKERFQAIFDDLLFIGTSIYSCAENDAEQIMVGDAIDVSFDKNDLFEFIRKPYFEYAFRHVVNMNEYEDSSFVMDETGEEDFIGASKNSFGVDYLDVAQLIGQLLLHHKVKVGEVLVTDRNDLSTGMNHLFNVSINNAEEFFSGMYFTQNHRHSIKDLVTKPYSINRFLYRPILIWNIDDKEYCVLGLFSVREAMTSLYLNAFPWCKAPDEWAKNEKFKKFLDKKKEEHDKWLDDAVEKEIKTIDVIFQRNVKAVVGKKKSIRIDDDKCGQLDFLVINESTKQIFVIECKHLLGRYDMASWKIDFYNFTEGNKEKLSWNANIERKINWVANNINFVEEHFQLRTKCPALSITDFKVEGIFIINTPTFYMYYSDFRIYTFHEVAKVLTNKYIDKEYTLVTIDDDYERTEWIRYPYFKEKKMFFYDGPDDDCEVDKYGFPIK